MTDHEVSRWEGWGNALGVTLLGCGLLGVGDFVLLGGYLATGTDLFAEAVWLQLGFAASLALIFILIALWQRSHASSLHALGWLRPTRPSAIVLGVLMGLAWLAMSAAGARRLLPGVDVFEFSLVRVLLAPVGLFMAIGEETMMRGFFMTQLDRARVPAWLQIIASGVCSGLYHGLQNFTLIGLLPSMVIFMLLAALYVFGKRSLTPSIIAHGMVHVCGEPYLLMMVLTIMAPSHGPY